MDKLPIDKLSHRYCYASIFGKHLLFKNYNLYHFFSNLTPYIFSYLKEIRFIYVTKRAYDTNNSKKKNCNDCSDKFEHLFI